MGAAQVAAVLVQGNEGDSEDAWIARARTIGACVQPRGTAMLLQGHENLVKRSGADGAHLTGIEPFQAAVSGLKPEHIAGVGGLTTRHDAMLAAELGADYIMFGGLGSDGVEVPFEGVIDRVRWWSEVFQIPCVGWANALSEVGEIAAAGAEFVAVSGFVWDDSRGPAAALADVAARLDSTEVVR